MTVRRARAVTVAKKNEKVKSKQFIVNGRAAALPQSVERVKQRCLAFFIDMWYNKYGDEMC